MAVMTVFASHASNIFFRGELLGWGGGQLGVMLFFVLSGFLMAYLYLDTVPDARSQCEFLINRIARIYPMFLFVVLLCFTVNACGIQLWVYPIASIKDVILNLSFVQGYGVLWTIGPEVVFYALFVMLWRLFTKSHLIFLSVIAVLSAMAWLPVTVSPVNSLFMLHTRLPYFFAGCLIGTMSPLLLQSSARSCYGYRVLFGLMAVAFVASFPQVIRLFAQTPAQLTGNPWSDPWSFPYYLLMTVLFVVTAILARPWILTNRVAICFGKISFSFYLWHYAVLKNVQALLPIAPRWGVVVAFALTAMLSTLSYRGMEIPCRRLIRRVARHTPSLRYGLGY
jgi:peptidoglycan/LPS O-acetylase OafA/YrhL